MMEIVPRLEKRTHYIATFANVITLVGLLGTIIGLIRRSLQWPTSIRPKRLSYSQRRSRSR